MKKIIIFVFTFATFAVGLAQTNTYKERSKCFIASQDFVKENLKYPQEATFSNSYVHEINGYGNCIIIGQVTAKNAFGVKILYTYKIWMTHNGKEWTDQRNWKYSKLILEDEQGKQSIINKEADKQITASKVKVLGYIDGIKCTLIEGNEYYTRIVTSKKLSKAQIAKSESILKIETDIIYFHLPGKTERGMDYGSKIGTMIQIF